MTQRIRVLVAVHGKILSISNDDCSITLTTQEVEHLIEELAIARQQMNPASRLQADAGRMPPMDE